MLSFSKPFTAADLRVYDSMPRFAYPASASLAQLVEHALRKRMVVGSIPTGGFRHFHALLQTFCHYTLARRRLDSFVGPSRHGGSWARDPLC